MGIQEARAGISLMSDRLLLQVYETAIESLKELEEAGLPTDTRKVAIVLFEEEIQLRMKAAAEKAENENDGT